MNSVESIINVYKISCRREAVFPEIREILGSVKLITTFSHSNLNLPVDELNSIDFLIKFMERANIKVQEVLCILYDNAIPELDNPKGYRIQYGAVNPEVLDKRVPYSFQKKMFYREEDLYRNGQNVVESIPDQNQDVFIRRFREVNGIYLNRIQENSLPPVRRIKRIREDFLSLLEIKTVEEVLFSGRPTRIVARVLSKLCEKGYPFWEMPVPDEFKKYKTSTFLVEGISPGGLRVPVKFVQGNFLIEGGESIPGEDIFSAIEDRRVIPTMPLIVLSLMAAPQVFHLGGGFWPRYAIPMAKEISLWLGLPEDTDKLVLSTGGIYSPYVYKKSKYYYGFPLIYSTFGKKFMKESLNSGNAVKVELQREVYL